MPDPDRCRPILERLTYDASADRQRLIRAFDTGGVRVLDSGLLARFEQVRQGLDAMSPGPPVLAISIGGSTTKAALVSLEDGRLRLHHLVARPNPPEPVPFSDFLDGLLLDDAHFADYLRQTDQPVISLSVAVLVLDGVPFHPSKIATLTGLVARELPRDADTHHLETNLQSWLRDRDLPAATIRYQSDGVLAHLGALGLDPEPAESSMLMVCGTGMATAVDARFVLCGMALTLTEEDPEIYPLDATEQGQYQYLIAGKGVAGIMQRIVRAHAQDPGAKLAGVDLTGHFAGPDDSSKVAFLAAAGEGYPLHGCIEPIRAELDDAQWDELVEIAQQVLRRGVDTLANCILSTHLCAARDASRRRRVYLEGSIATDPVVSKMLAESLDRCARAACRAGECAEPVEFELLIPDVEARFGAGADATVAGAALLGLGARDDVPAAKQAQQ